MSFEDRLGELLKDEDPLAPGPDPGAVILGARRRRLRRRAGAGAAALAVALVCGVTAVTAGSTRHVGDVAAEAGAAMTPPAAAALAPEAAPTPTTIPTPTTTPAPTATPTASALPLSPVRRVGVGEKIDVIDGTRIWVTPTQRCDESRGPDGVWRSTFGCRDVTSDNLDHSKPNIYTQGAENADHDVLFGMFLGPVTPARLVAFRDGKPYVATLVTAPGMKDWAAYYVVLPHKAPEPKGHEQIGTTVAGYDADGKLVAENPAYRTDGTHDRAPATL
ncbi:hypothetical protein ACGF12_08495 [Kitasatospora sp. NPDC048296]|uniref:hypothetical protein n=1 Tax=Kitasatospora sp. NPDC048296 TaxID=3364048 RepID=UPI00371B57BE